MLKKSYYCYLNLYLLSTCFLGFYLIFSYRLTGWADITRYYGFIFTTYSIGLAVIQYRINHEVDRRERAYNLSWKMKEHLNKNTVVINRSLGFLERGINEEISLDRIHLAICKTKDGKLEKDKNGNFIVNYNGDGHLTKQAIYSILNTYEYISIGVELHLLDEDIIKKLFGYSITDTYFAFKNYIEHCNRTEFPECKGTVWSNLKILALKFFAEEKRIRSE